MSPLAIIILGSSATVLFTCCAVAFLLGRRYGKILGVQSCIRSLLSSKSPELWEAARYVQIDQNQTTTE